MSDYISRGTFIADCKGRYCSPCKEQGKDWNGVRCRACWVDDMLLEVLDAPAADVEPVRRGKNLDAEWPSLFTCSACGWSDGDTTTGDTMSYNYCPNCGAKMDFEEENNDD